jgi:hypothetical protein
VQPCKERKRLVQFKKEKRKKGKGRQVPVKEEIGRASRSKEGGFTQKPCLRLSSEAIEKRKESKFLLGFLQQCSSFFSPYLGAISIGPKHCHLNSRTSFFEEGEIDAE